MKGAWLFGVLTMLAAPHAHASDVIVLDNGTIRFEVTPSFGGRGVGFSLHGQSNLLKVGDAVRAQPSPRVDADADDIAYLGHDVWLGPQSTWWSDQDVNTARRDVRAAWPPDPYLSFARQRIVERDDRAVTMEGVASPVTGVRLRKHFRLADDRDDTVVLEVEATNIRNRRVRRDLWFNTRMSAATQVYVPVHDETHVRIRSDEGRELAPLRTYIDAGVLCIERAPLQPGIQARRGKIFIAPSAGWIAGFADRQLLLIRFDLQPAAAIHPEQGQVELYLDEPADAANGLLELEVHAPFRELEPGARMSAKETWTVLRYDGPATAEAHRAFLCGAASAQLAQALCETASPAANVQSRPSRFTAR